MTAQSGFCLRLILLSILSLVTSSAQNPENKKPPTCFKSSDKEAVNATQLHGSHDDEGLLWSRDPDTSAPLPRCSSSSFSPPPSHCDVCLLEEVYMICDNLPDRAKLHLERPGKPYKSSSCTCPTLPPADVAKPGESETIVSEPTNERGRIGLYVALACFIAVILLLIVGFVYKPQQLILKGLEA